MANKPKFKKTQKEWDDLLAENEKLKFALELIADDEEDLPFSVKIARLALDEDLV